MILKLVVSCHLVLGNPNTRGHYPI